jgi:hypothetical protein
LRARTPGVLALAVLVTAPVLLGACGSDNPDIAAADARKVAVIEPSVPESLRGLQVQKEDIRTSLEGVKRPYFDGISFLSLREGEKLQATLQIGRFAEGTRYRSRSFRSSLLATIGGGSAKELRMGDDRVFLTSGDRQSIAVWFRDRYVFILSSREDYEFPRSLLREALAVKP